MKDTCWCKNYISNSEHVYEVMMTSVVFNDQLTTSNSSRKTSATCSKLADTNCRRQFPSKDIQKSNVSSAYLGCSGNGSTIPNFYVRRSVLINSQRLTPRSPKVLHQTYLRLVVTLFTIILNNNILIKHNKRSLTRVATYRIN